MASPPAPPPPAPPPESSSSSTVCVRVAGALKGVVRVSSFDAPVSELRAEVARLLGAPSEAAGSIKLIAGGRTLADDAAPLSSFKVSAASRVLVTRGAAGAGDVAGAEAAQRSEEERLAHLGRLKAALHKMAARGGSDGEGRGAALTLENQDGSEMRLGQADKQALVFALAMQERGKASLAAGKVQEALDVLLLAEESFGVVQDRTLLAGVDNVALLLLDIVWCYFKLRDVNRLGVCGERLASARRMLAIAHGPNQERLRLLHGNWRPQVTTYLRLELLEGVVAFHSGEAAAAAQRLASAHARWQRLQLDEASLLQLAELGYSTRNAARALRFSGGDVAAAVDFLSAQQQKQQERRAARQARAAWVQERPAFGKTAAGKWVDQQRLQGLCQLGYEQPLAAEALRQADNDTNAALDLLASTVQRGALQLAIVTRRIIDEEDGPQWVKAAHVERLRAAGFKERAARLALAAEGDKVSRALTKLQEMGDDVREFPAADAMDAEAAAAAAAPGSDAKRPRRDGSAAGADGGASSSRAAAEARRANRDAAGDGARSSDDSEPSDAEIEAEIASVVGRPEADPLAAYDVDCTEDGAAIQLYLSLLESASASAAAGAGDAAGAAAG